MSDAAQTSGVPVGKLTVLPPVEKPKAKRTRPLAPKVEQALRLYATGAATREQAKAAAGVSSSAFSLALNSEQGQLVMSAVRDDLEHQFQAQFKQVIDVIGQGLNHCEPAVALASAKLWLTANRGSKVEVKVTAEDLIQQLLKGTL